jgi:hypothetical protein
MDLQSLKIFDNGGKTWDRYTIVINNSVYSMSINPNSPDGINQYLFDVVNLRTTELGKKIEINQVNKEVLIAIINRIID